MPRLSFPRGYEGEENLPRTWRDTLNCWTNDEGRLIQRPGIDGLNTTARVARGAFEWMGSLYQVASTDLIKITDRTTGAFSVIGTVAGSESIETAIGFNHAVIVVKGGALYTLDSSDVLVDISGNTNFVACVDVTHINGRFVYIPADGSPAFFSDVGTAGTVQATSFFDAEELPDSNKAAINFRNTLIIGGTDSLEFFRDSGEDPVPFARVPGARVQFGFIGGLLAYADTLIFIGRATGQDAGIFALSGGTAVKISNARIDLALTKYTNAQLEDVIANRYNWRGYDIATFNLPLDSFGYFNGRWHTMNTSFSGALRPWGGGYLCQCGGEYFTAFEDKIGKLFKGNTDYGERITRIVNMGFEQEENKQFAIQSLELGVTQGFNSGTGSIAVRMSNDNVTFKTPLYRNLSAIGKYSDRLRWNPMGGMGSYHGFAAFSLYTTEDIDITSDHVEVKFR